MASVPNTLRFVRLLHTLVWALFAGCIIAIPVCALLGKYAHSSVLSGIVLYAAGILLTLLLWTGWLR